MNIINDGNIKFDSLMKFFPATVGPAKKATPTIPKKLKINISISSILIFFVTLIFFDNNNINIGPKLKRG